MPPEQFAALLDGCRRGDEDAFRVLVGRFFPQVQAAVRRRLPPLLRGRFDSTDFTQDVWASLVRTGVGRLRLDSEADLVNFLMTLANRKVEEGYRHQTCQKRAVDRDTPLSDMTEPPAGGPTPSVAVMARERWDRMVADLDDGERAMLDMLLAGHSQTAIAAALGVNIKTVGRFIDRMEQVHLWGTSA